MYRRVGWEELGGITVIEEPLVFLNKKRITTVIPKQMKDLIESYKDTTQKTNKRIVKSEKKNKTLLKFVSFQRFY